MNIKFYWEEIKELKKYLLAWFYSFLIIAFALFAIGLGKAEILGLHLQLPIFSERSFAVMFFEMVRTNLVPAGVDLIATSPSSAFVSQTIIAILGAFILTFPYLIYKVFQFLSPALYSKEKRKILKILLPTAILFFGGVVFAYLFIIPPTFRVLYSFNKVLGVMPFFAVSEFISWTLSLMFTTGLMFLLPVFMYILSWIGIIPAEVWFKNWRTALGVFVVGSAVITPDGTGVTMVLLTLPMMALYLVGASLCKKEIKEIKN
jgi:sec-independent protein translocase protein TatC